MIDPMNFNREVSVFLAELADYYRARPQDASAETTARFEALMKRKHDLLARIGDS